MMIQALNSILHQRGSMEIGDDSDLSGSDRECEVQTVRRTARQRVPKRVLTYDSLSGEPKIKRYTLYYCGNWDAAV